jgi:hypothetical protein
MKQIINILKLKTTALIILLLAVILIIAMNYYKINSEKLKNRIYKYEMYNANDTCTIIQIILQKEESSGRLKIAPGEKLMIQLFPYLSKGYKISGYENKIEYSNENYGFHTPNNYLIFLTFRMMPDSTAQSEYNFGYCKGFITLKKDSLWRVERHLQGM